MIFPFLCDLLSVLNLKHNFTCRLQIYLTFYFIKARSPSLIYCFMKSFLLPYESFELSSPLLNLGGCLSDPFYNYSIKTVNCNTVGFSFFFRNINLETHAEFIMFHRLLVSSFWKSSFLLYECFFFINSLHWPTHA